MAMDFFEHQEVARQKTKKLVAIFVVGVLAIIVSVHAAVSLVAWQTTSRISTSAWEPGGSMEGFILNAELFGWVALGVVAVVSAGSLYKISALGGGGEKVATTLGGTRLDPGTDDPDERRLLNVVEEMAIASGVPVPPVFVMEREEAINAFAAGFEPGDAVIGVTRGAVRHLDRDELQGVIAHEFSHILNGDMRLNIRLIGILHGVLLIGIIGRVLLRSGGRRRGKGNQAAILGLALLVIGYLGTLCGNLIKAAVSREREFLADASAVQFTRNPDGIAGALKKLGGLDEGSRLEHPRASELSHMYFGNGIVNHLGSLFSTHPPLEERVRRIDPSFEGRFPRVSAGGAALGTGEAMTGAEGAALDRREDGASTRQAADPGAEAAGVAGLAVAGGGGAGNEEVGRKGAEDVGDLQDGEATEADSPASGTGEPRRQGVVSLDDALARVGRPTRAHLVHVHRLMEAVPGRVRAAAHEKDGAEALLYALLMDSDPKVTARQIETLKTGTSPELREKVRALLPDAADLDPNARLPLLEVVIATLKGTDDDAYRRLRDTVRALTEADDDVELFEWVVGSLVIRHLDPRTGEERRKGRYTRVQGLSDSVVLVLSALAHAGHDATGEAETAFQEGIGVLSELDGEALLPRSSCGHQALEAALDQLSHLVPAQKKRVLEACARAIAADRRVTTREGELFRVVADWMSCPVPPLLPGQRVTKATG